MPATDRLDPNDTIVLFLDLQEGIAGLSKSNPLPRLRKSVSTLGRLASLFEMPVIVSAIREGGKDAVMLPEIQDAIGDYVIHYRTTCDCFRNDEVRSKIEESGRKTVLLSGVATELAVQLPALSAADAGLRAFVVVDACGGMSERTERAALDRIHAAGANSISVMTVAGEIAGDLRGPKAQQAVGILFEIAQL